jgi:hypothetical protein
VHAPSLERSSGSLLVNSLHTCWQGTRRLSAACPPPPLLTCAQPVARVCLLSSHARVCLAMHGHVVCFTHVHCSQLMSHKAVRCGPDFHRGGRSQLVDRVAGQACVVGCPQSLCLLPMHGNGSHHRWCCTLCRCRTSGLTLDAPWHHCYPLSCLHACTLAHTQSLSLMSQPHTQSVTHHSPTRSVTRSLLLPKAEKQPEKKTASNVGQLETEKVRVLPRASIGNKRASEWLVLLRASERGYSARRALKLRVWR